MTLEGGDAGRPTKIAPAGSVCNREQRRCVVPGYVSLAIILSGEDAAFAAVAEIG